ncbi:acetyl-CoA synthetase-like protein [Aspergillus candidus]|uniref:Acetyl-CoA synthetase-like protein n=1 Tax=Aspergillus candidus TaxID=41067 RepID=A0A2I2FMG7_ASPCN|nr:acetyl-CoA synthetase-like protein [Aspergillus candidus]PLB41836.1 acetyl-CoA synthetase-like protein [Aspergillus candidus]
MSNGDRTLLVPPHTGDHVLPNLPFLGKLLQYANRSTSRIAIRDVHAGVEKTYAQLLVDGLALRKKLQETLSPDIQEDLLHDREVPIALLAPGGYQYAVGFIAILALGAAVVPLTVVLPTEEASALVHRARCAAIVCSRGSINLAQSVTSIHGNIFYQSIQPYTNSNPTALMIDKITISSNRELDPNLASLIIFTSGTTGPPKGAVQRRSYLTRAAEAIADHYGITETDTILHMLPVHHITGVAINFLPYLTIGACVEFRSGGFDAAWTWERWSRGGLTVFSGVPTIYIRMMRYFESNQLPEEKRQAYVHGAQSLRVLLCGTSALPAPVQDFWTRILDGKRILTRYGATEIGVCFMMGVDDARTPPNSVGRAVPGLEVKLDENGMVLVKGPHIFSKYLYDKKATADAHDAEGYFKTGDIARKEGPYYFILGRASLDIIKSGGYKISALDIEREVLGLDYVAEVMVVGVPDDEFGQRVGAAVCLKDSSRGRKGLLERLRHDLRSKLAGYKLPTVLRVVQGELPKSATGKVQKRILGPEYFPVGYAASGEVEVWEGRKLKL